MPDGALAHPAFGDQPLGDGRDGAALQTRMARQIGARDGLVLADQVEQHAPVDVARRLAGRHLYVIQIYLSHGSVRTGANGKTKPSLRSSLLFGWRTIFNSPIEVNRERVGQQNFRFLYNL